MMSKGNRKWYPFDMTYYDEIFEEAADNYGLITTAKARQMGIGKQELSKLSARGKLTHVGRGVYRIKHYVPTPLDVYADAVALVGDGSFIADESVLALHGLASVNPESVLVGTPKRVRRQLPGYVEAVQIHENDRVTAYCGVPSMPVADAIRRCEGRVMPERLLEALRDGFDQGLISRKEYRALEKELS